MSDKAVNYIQGYEDGYEDGLREKTDTHNVVGATWQFNGKWYYHCNHCHQEFYIVDFSLFEFKYCPACGYRIR